MVDAGPADQRRQIQRNEVEIMRTIMGWIDGIVSKLAHRKVRRDEGNPR